MDAGDGGTNAQGLGGQHGAEGEDTVWRWMMMGAEMHKPSAVVVYTCVVVARRPIDEINTIQIYNTIQYPHQKPALDGRHAASGSAGAGACSAHTGSNSDVHGRP